MLSAHVVIDTGDTLLIMPLTAILLAQRTVMSSTGLQSCYRHPYCRSLSVDKRQCNTWLLLAESYWKSGESGAGETIRCNHLSGKLGSVSEIDSCQENVVKLPK